MPAKWQSQQKSISTAYLEFLYCRAYSRELIRQSRRYWGLQHRVNVFQDSLIMQYYTREGQKYFVTRSYITWKGPMCSFTCDILWMCRTGERIYIEGFLLSLHVCFMLHMLLSLFPTGGGFLFAGGQRLRSRRLEIADHHSGLGVKRKIERDNIRRYRQHHALGANGLVANFRRESTKVLEKNIKKKP